VKNTKYKVHKTIFKNNTIHVSLVSQDCWANTNLLTYLLTYEVRSSATRRWLFDSIIRERCRVGQNFGWLDHIATAPANNWPMYLRLLSV